MDNSCKSCGAPSTSSRISDSWTCDFCGSVNHSEAYLDAYLANIDVAKMSNLMRIAKAAYEAGRYEEAAEKFDEALKEDSENAEAWAYKALARAHTADLSNAGQVLAEVNEYFTVGSSLRGADEEFFGVARELAQERIVDELIRVANREYAEALKIERVFASTSPGEAAVRSSRRYANALAALAACFASPSTNILQMIEVCSLTIAVADASDLPSSETGRDVAVAFLVKAAEEYPSLNINLDALAKKPTVQKAACFPGYAIVATGPGSSRPILELTAGQFVYAYDVDRQAWRYVTVTRVRRHISVPVSRLSFAGGGFLDATESHTVLTGRGWRKVSDLENGDVCVFSSPGTEPTALAIEHIDRNRELHPVYSYGTSSGHVTCVDGVVVHEFSRLRMLRTCLAKLVFLVRQARGLFEGGSVATNFSGKKNTPH